MRRHRLMRPPLIKLLAIRLSRIKRLPDSTLLHPRCAGWQFDRSHAQRGNAATDALRRKGYTPLQGQGRGASTAALPRRAWERYKSSILLSPSSQGQIEEIFV